MLSPIPWKMKVHPSVAYHFGLFDSSNESKHLETRYAFPDDSDVANSVLVVSFGLGVPSKRTYSFQKIKKSIVSSLATNHPADHFDHLFSSEWKNAEDSSSVWTSARDRLRNGDEVRMASSVSPQCSFDQLEFVDAKGVIHVHKLNSIHSRVEQGIRDKTDVSSHTMAARSCLASLLAALVANKDVIDVRFRGPIRLLNANAKAIIQSGAVNSNYPYHDVGLTGEGLVAGVADSGSHSDRRIRMYTVASVRASFNTLICILQEWMSTVATFPTKTAPAWRGATTDVPRQT